MKETLAMLVELQSIEDELRDLRLTRNKLEALDKDNGEAREIFEQMLAERAAQIEEVRTFCSEKEAGIKEAEENTKRARSRLTTITSQRELTALNKELDSARRQNNQRSEELLKLMEQLEEAQADFDKKRGEFESLKGQMAAAAQGLIDAIAEREASATAHRARQAELRKLVGAPLYGKFNRIVKARKGKAVVHVSVDGTCSGCRISTMPQQLIRIRRMTSLESCQNCGRMLVWDPANDVEEASAAVEG